MSDNSSSFSSPAFTRRRLLTSAALGAAAVGGSVTGTGRARAATPSAASP